MQIKSIPDTYAATTGLDEETVNYVALAGDVTRAQPIVQAKFVTDLAVAGVKMNVAALQAGRGFLEKADKLLKQASQKLQFYMYSYRDYVSATWSYHQRHFLSDPDRPDLNTFNFVECSLHSFDTAGSSFHAGDRESHFFGSADLARFRIGVRAIAAHEATTEKSDGCEMENCFHDSR